MADIAAKHACNDAVPSLAAEALLRLPPELLTRLARLAGTPLNDLSRAIEDMPYAYRATLCAYGLIDMHATHPNHVDAPRRVTATLALAAVATAAATKSARPTTDASTTIGNETDPIP